MFSVGQKVICINDNFDNLNDITRCSLPKFGHAYTIRSIRQDGVLLNEITNPVFKFIRCNNIITEPYFHQSRFVPAIDESEVIETEKLEYA